MARTKRKTTSEMTGRDWIHLGIIAVVCNFVLPPVLRWLGVPAIPCLHLPKTVVMGLISVACVGVLVWFVGHVRRERREHRRGST